MNRTQTSCNFIRNEIPWENPRMSVDHSHWVNTGSFKTCIAIVSMKHYRMSDKTVCFTNTGIAFQQRQVFCDFFCFSLAKCCNFVLSLSLEGDLVGKMKILLFILFFFLLNLWTHLHTCVLLALFFSVLQAFSIATVIQGKFVCTLMQVNAGSAMDGKPSRRTG